MGTLYKQMNAWRIRKKIWYKKTKRERSGGMRSRKEKQVTKNVTQKDQHGVTLRRSSGNTTARRRGLTATRPIQLETSREEKQARHVQVMTFCSWNLYSLSIRRRRYCPKASLNSKMSISSPCKSLSKESIMNVKYNIHASQIPRKVPTSRSKVVTMRDYQLMHF